MLIGRPSIPYLLIPEVVVRRNNISAAGRASSLSVSSRYSSDSNPVLRSVLSSNSSWISLISALLMIESLPVRTLSYPTNTAGSYVAIDPSGSSMSTVPSSLIFATLNFCKGLDVLSLSYSRPTSRSSV